MSEDGKARRRRHWATAAMVMMTGGGVAVGGCTPPSMTDIREQVHREMGLDR